MPVATVADFLDALQAVPLLDDAQQKQVAALREQCADVKALGQELIRRGLLTTFQANQIARGRGSDLVLDQYILVDLLGKGGMGAVYKARQRRMDRFVALKLIRREALNRPGAVERFQREAKAAAKLSHPNVVHVYDTNQINGVPYLVMEYLEGSDLAKLVKERGPLPVGFACDCIRQAALGLQHAYEQGLIHRDIKPHNLMLTNQGVVKVMDLGLARVRTEAGAASEGLTATGAAMGTPDYIAPEQALNAKGVDIRADIYSLGCSLYHMLTGRTPFVGETVTEKLIKHQLEDPAPIEQLRPGLPKGLPAVVRKMMAKKTEQRYQAPAEVAQALEIFGQKSADSATWPMVEAGDSVPPTIAVQEAAPAWNPLPQPPQVDQKTKPTTLSDRSRTSRRMGYRLLVGLAAAVLLAVCSIPFVIVSWAKRDPTPLVVVRPTQQPEPTPTDDPLAGKNEIVNSIGMRLVKIPAGKFTMGSPNVEPGRKDNEMQHEVTISKPFHLGVYAVTQEEYEKVMKTNPSHFRVGGQGETSVKGLDTHRFPVETVSWNDAQEFCKKLSELPDEKKAGRTYRLPTEAEWEYACRAGATTPFSFGKECNGKQANCNGNEPYGTEEKGPSLQRPCPVGLYAPNAFGLYDMHGNVWQWCEDCFGDYPTGAVTDPKGPENGTGRALRGGSWDHKPVYARAAYRSVYGPGDRGSNNGVRVAFRLD